MKQKNKKKPKKKGKKRKRKERREVRKEKGKKGQRKEKARKKKKKKEKPKLAPYSHHRTRLLLPSSRLLPDAPPAVTTPTRQPCPPAIVKTLP
jgi:hypothetical protein